MSGNSDPIGTVGIWGMLLSGLGLVVAKLFGKDQHTYQGEVVSMDTKSSNPQSQNPSDSNPNSEDLSVSINRKDTEDISFNNIEIGSEGVNNRAPEKPLEKSIDISDRSIG